MAAVTSSATTPAKEPLVGNYYVAAYPPFSVWQPEQIPALEAALQHPAPAAPLGLYLHVPFCQKKCDYCYYLSYVGQKAATVNRYLEAAVEELSRYASLPAVQGRRVSFVYFGGGTPSSLSSDQFRFLADGLCGSLDWNGVEEVTFECAPRSVRREFLETLRDNRVTRLSMGVQSFDDELLQLNGRVHLVEDVLRSYELIRKTGFNCVNLDLMVGLMGETAEKWRDSVRRMIELGPESVTIYQTEIPHNTQLYRDLKAGTLPAAPVSWSEKRNRLAYAFEELERAGYTVVSAYNAVKDPQRHRFLYQHYLWHGADMLGLGVASFGYFGGAHYQNAVTLENYLDAVEQGRLPIQRAFRLSAHDQLVREFVLQLKLGAVSVTEFREKFDRDVTKLFARALRVLAAEGFLTCLEDEVRLTRDGLLHADWLLPYFFDPQYRHVRYT